MITKIIFIISAIICGAGVIYNIKIKHDTNKLVSEMLQSVPKYNKQ